jgi:hypothetical protein
MDTARWHRWVKASHALDTIEPYMVVTAQGLGWLDCRLIDDAELIGYGTPSVSQGMMLQEHLTLSYLWVLGAYELVRSADQRVRAQISEPGLKAIGELKAKLARLRIPLAKFEAARAHRDTDSPVAWPAWGPGHGAAWRVAPDVFIGRRELADDVLQVLESGPR